MAHISELFLKVKLHGLGWDRDPSSQLAYASLQQKMAELLQKDEHLVSTGANKTVSVIICRELDHGGYGSLHSIEGSNLTVQQETIFPVASRFE